MRKWLHFITSLGLGLCTVRAAEPLAVGADAPKVEAKNQDGETLKLEEIYQKGLVLVYFFPKALTGG